MAERSPSHWCEPFQQHQDGPLQFGQQKGEEQLALSMIQKSKLNEVSSQLTRPNLGLEHRRMWFLFKAVQRCQRATWFLNNFGTLFPGKRKSCSFAREGHGETNRCALSNFILPREVWSEAIWIQFLDSEQADGVECVWCKDLRGRKCWRQEEEILAYLLPFSSSFADDCNSSWLWK